MYDHTYIPINGPYAGIHGHLDTLGDIMRTPTYTNVRTHPTANRVHVTNRQGVTLIRPTRTVARRMAMRLHFHAFRRTVRHATGWACLIAFTVALSVLASAYTTGRLTDEVQPAPHYTWWSSVCPTEDSCVPSWNGVTYDWIPVVP